MTTTPTPPDHFPDATKMVTPLEDDVKRLRDPLAPFAWCIESLDSADWCWSASVEGVKLNSELLDPGCTPSEPFAVVRKSDHDERIARLLAHIEAQAEELRISKQSEREGWRYSDEIKRDLEAAERLSADRLEQMNADRKQAISWRDRLEVAEADANRYRFALECEVRCARVYVPSLDIEAFKAMRRANADLEMAMIPEATHRTAIAKDHQ